jgi:N-acetylornithine carbamoyltransferase
VLAGKTLGMMFFQPSLRTRVSFEVAMVQLGGHCINLSSNDLYELEPQEQAVMDGAAEEHVKDAARTLSRYVDALGIRSASRTGTWERDRQELLLRSYAKYASVPVINLETSFEHPCQALADVLTMRENLVSLKGRKLTLLWCNHPEPKSLGPTHSILQLAALHGHADDAGPPARLRSRRRGARRSKTQVAQDAGGSLQVSQRHARPRPRRRSALRALVGLHKHWHDAEREAMVKRSLQSGASTSR